uniref:Dynein light chain n=1 Tax=Scophthalmus maximus TaxID=52904 RepID=A0A8D3BU05_SCOMX
MRPSAGLEQQDGHLTQVEVNEMLGLMSHVAAKVPPNDAVPGWVIFLVKLLLGTKANVFLDVVLLQGLRGTLHGVLLHVLRHVSVLDHCLSVRHGLSFGCFWLHFISNHHALRHGRCCSNRSKQLLWRRHIVELCNNVCFCSTQHKKST